MQVFRRVISESKYILIVILVIVSIRLFFVTPIVVAGPSMMPTLFDEDKVLVNKIGPKLVGYERFDVIVFNSKAGEIYVKRIIGLPGEMIHYSNDQLFINGQFIEEPFLQSIKNELIYGKYTGNFNLETLYNLNKIPDNYYFVLGDNRLNSNDSRQPKFVGLVHKDDIIGQVMYTIYPWKNIQKIK